MTQMMAAADQRLDFNDMKDKLAKQMMASKVENHRKQAEIYRICQESDELKALKAQIHAAYLNKERAAQVAENQFRSQRGLEEETEFERDQLIRKEREERLEKERQKMARESAIHNKNNIQNQMLEKEKLKEEAYQEYLKEKQQVDRVVQALIAEDQETAHQLQLKKEQAQADMMQSLYEKQMQQKRMKEMNQEQEERVRKYAELQEERLNQILGQRAKAAAQKEQILNKLAAEEERRRAEQEYIQNLRIELNQEEAQEREREKERLQRERREQVRLELLESKKLQEEIKQQRNEQEKALEQNFRIKMMEKFAEDDRIDQMNAQKRRMKELEHKREVERLWNEKLELYRWQRDQEIIEKRIKDEEERQKQQIIEMEKQRLLDEHSELLRNYHPKAAVFDDQFNDSSLGNWDREVEDENKTVNNEWEHYTKSSKNSYTQGGNLYIVAIKEHYGKYKYTSAKLVSRQDYGPYGFFTIRAKMPYGEGSWPAFWLLPRNAQSKYGRWPACGQISVYQSVQSDKKAYGTIHFGGPGSHHYAPSNNNLGKYDIENWHTYSVDWQPDQICWFVDAEIVNGEINKNPVYCVSSQKWFSEDQYGHRFPGNAPFDQKFTMIINVAVGGNFPCGQGPCEYVRMPETFKMQVDYVQIWEQMLQQDDDNDGNDDDDNDDDDNDDDDDDRQQEIQADPEEVE